jgi:hypothetical protein
MDGPNRSDIVVSDQKEGEIQLHSEKGMTKYRIITLPETKYAVMAENFEINTESEIIEMIKRKLWMENFRL